jgi:hypothetical protein
VYQPTKLALLERIAERVFSPPGIPDGPGPSFDMIKRGESYSERNANPCISFAAAP